MLKVLTMLMAFAGVASAQLPELAQGARLKLDLAGPAKLEGTLLSQTPDSLVVAADGARIVKLSSSSVGRIRSTAGKTHGAGAKKGAKIGTIVGAGFGVLVGLAFMNDGSYAYGNAGFDQSAAPLVFGVVGAAEGALYGLAIGAIVGAQNWKTIYERPYRVSASPMQGGMRLGLSVRY
jgi:hypothetical protein